MTSVWPKIPAVFVRVPLEEEMSIREPSVFVMRRPSPLESVVNIGGIHDGDEAVTVLRE